MMRALPLVIGLLLVTGCASNAHIPGSAGDYTSQVLSTERGQLLIGRTVCQVVGESTDREDLALSLINNSKVEPAEARRFVDEALAQCQYLISPEVKDRLVELGAGQWVS